MEHEINNALRKIGAMTILNDQTRDARHIKVHKCVCRHKYFIYIFIFRDGYKNRLLFEKCK